MAWSFTDIKYGWKILAGIVLTGATIFVVDNARKRIMAKDLVEAILGTTERCLATQYGTNAAGDLLYYVDPPSFVRSWYSNAYVGTNAILYTNVFTNVISWRTDRQMIVDLDTTIKALVPYYCDTNTVYDGTINIAMLTVTGLWASLGIGDGTNQFTRTPAIGTNVATYGDYPWRIYTEDLEERYKVLEALKMTSFSPSSLAVASNCAFVSASSTSSLSEAKSRAEVNWGAVTNTSSWVDAGYDESASPYVLSSVLKGAGSNYFAGAKRAMKTYQISGVNTSINHEAKFYLKATVYPGGGYPTEFDDSGSGVLENRFKGFDSEELIMSDTYTFKINSYSFPPGTFPDWPDTPESGYAYRGFITEATNAIIDWNFLYCKDKYW